MCAAALPVSAADCLTMLQKAVTGRSSIPYTSILLPDPTTTIVPALTPGPALAPVQYQAGRRLQSDSGMSLLCHHVWLDRTGDKLLQGLRRCSRTAEGSSRSRMHTTAGALLISCSKAASCSPALTRRSPAGEDSFLHRQTAASTRSHLLTPLTQVLGVLLYAGRAQAHSEA